MSEKEETELEDIRKELDTEKDNIIQKAENQPTDEKTDEFIVEPTNEEDKLYIKWKKMELENILASGQFKEEGQIYGMVDGYIIEVFRHHPSKTILTQYLKDQLEIKEKINTINQQMIPLDKKRTKLIDDYTTNAKDILDQIRIL